MQFAIDHSPNYIVRLKVHKYNRYDDQSKYAFFLESSNHTKKILSSRPRDCFEVHVFNNIKAFKEYYSNGTSVSNNPHTTILLEKGVHDSLWRPSSESDNTIKKKKNYYIVLIIDRFKLLNIENSKSTDDGYYFYNETPLNLASSLVGFIDIMADVKETSSYGHNVLVGTEVNVPTGRYFKFKQYKDVESKSPEELYNKYAGSGDRRSDAWAGKTYVPPSMPLKDTFSHPIEFPVPCNYTAKKIREYGSHGKILYFLCEENERATGVSIRRYALESEQSVSRSMEGGLPYLHHWETKDFNVYTPTYITHDVANTTTTQYIFNPNIHHFNLPEVDKSGTHHYKVYRNSDNRRYLMCNGDKDECYARLIEPFGLRPMDWKELQSRLDVYGRDDPKNGNLSVHVPISDDLNGQPFVLYKQDYDDQQKSKEDDFGTERCKKGDLYLASGDDTKAPKKVDAPKYLEHGYVRMKPGYTRIVDFIRDSALYGRAINKDKPLDTYGTHRQFHYYPRHFYQISEEDKNFFIDCLRDLLERAEHHSQRPCDIRTVMLKYGTLSFKDRGMTKDKGYLGFPYKGGYDLFLNDMDDMKYYKREGAPANRKTEWDMMGNHPNAPETIVRGNGSSSSTTHTGTSAASVAFGEAFAANESHKKTDSEMVAVLPAENKLFKLIWQNVFFPHVCNVNHPQVGPKQDRLSCTSLDLGTSNVLKIINQTYNHLGKNINEFKDDSPKPIPHPPPGTTRTLYRPIAHTIDKIYEKDPSDPHNKIVDKNVPHATAKAIFDILSGTAPKCNLYIATPPAAAATTSGNEVYFYMEILEILKRQTMILHYKKPKVCNSYTKGFRSPFVTDNYPTLQNLCMKELINNNKPEIDKYYCGIYNDSGSKKIATGMKGRRRKICTEINYHKLPRYFFNMDFGTYFLQHDSAPKTEIYAFRSAYRAVNDMFQDIDKAPTTGQGYSLKDLVCGGYKDIYKYIVPDNEDYVEVSTFVAANKDHVEDQIKILRDFLEKDPIINDRARIHIENRYKDNMEQNGIIVLPCMIPGVTTTKSELDAQIKGGIPNHPKNPFATQTP